jgi:hypothetical protein
MATDRTVEGVEEILRGFARLSAGVQKKYLGSSVRAATKEEVPKIKALTPRGPTGNLRRSVGFKLEKKKTTTAVGVLGYRARGNGTNRELGFHAWWIANGVATRTPKGPVLAAPMALAKQYPYMMGNVQRIGGPRPPFAYWYEVFGFKGDGKFQQWSEAALPQIKARLVGTLGANLGKAIAEEERRLLRKKYKK